MITAKQVNEIQKIIEEHQTAISFLATGVAPSREDIAVLKRKGVLAADVPEDLITDAFVYGLLAVLDPEVLTKPAEIILEEVRKIELSAFQKKTAEYLREKAGIYMKGLGNRIDTGLMRIVYDARKEELMRDAYKQTLRAGTELYQNRSQIVTALRDFTGDFHRDLERVVNTELHFARTEGIAQSIRERWGAEAFAFVRPNKDACPLCKEAYIEVDGKPKIFRLQALEISNVGRSKEEIAIRPGKPPVHPNCFCQLFHIDPQEQEFNDQGELVFRPKISV